MRFSLASRYTVALLCLGMASLLFFAACGQQEDELQPGRATPLDRKLFLAPTDSLLKAKPYSVQVAALTDTANVARLTTQLQRSDLPVFVSRSQETGSDIFRIRVGPYAQERNAARALLAIRDLGFIDAFLKNHGKEIDTLVAAPAMEEALTSTELKKLTDAGGTCRSPKWSPTGREIAFINVGPESTGLYAVGTGGGSFSRIVDKSTDFEVTGEFAWSPSGKRMALVVREINHSFERVENIYVVNKNGTGLKRVLRQTDFAYKIHNLSWSPDERYLAFEAHYGEPEGIAADYIIQIKALKIAGEDSEPSLPQALDLQKNQLLAGWLTATEIVYLSSVKQEYWASRLSYEIAKLDVTTGRQSTLRRGPVVHNCKHLNMAAANNVLVYKTTVGSPSEQADRIVSYNWSNGQEYVLVDTQDEPGQLSNPIVTARNEVLFLHGAKLWINDLTERKAVLPFGREIDSFTASPSGARICFEERGELYLMRLPAL